MSHRRPHRTPSRRCRPTLGDRLEGRIVPSHAATSPAAIHAAARPAPATVSVKVAPGLSAQLAAAGARINQAYPTFAAAVREAELAGFEVATAVNSSGAKVNTTVLVNPQTVAAVTGAIDALKQSVTAASGLVSGADRGGADLIAAGLIGPGSGSLLGQMTAILAEAEAESQVKVGPIAYQNGTAAPEASRFDEVLTVVPSTPTSGTIGVLSLDQFYATVEGVMVAFDNTTAVETYLAALPASGRAPTDFAAVAAPINAAYGPLIAALGQVEGSLTPIFLPAQEAVTRASTTAGSLGSDGGSLAVAASPTYVPTTALDLRAMVDSATFAAGTALDSGLATTAAAGALPLIQGQVSGEVPFSLVTQLDATVAAAGASDDLHFNLRSYGLLDLALNSAVAASYNATAIEAYLAATA